MMYQNHDKHVRREMRRRCDILHRAVDVSNYSFEADTFPSYSSSPVYVEQELHRRHITTPVLQIRANDFAIKVVGLEPNPVVRAAFGVERAVDEGLQSLAFNHAVPECFVDGIAYKARFDLLKNVDQFEQVDWSCFTVADIKSIRELQVTASEVAGTGIISAVWQPGNPASVVTCDPMRPPIEAMVLAARAITSDRPPAGVTQYLPQAFPAVLCIGLGFAAATQALSVLLPGHQVYHQPVPFHTFHLPEENWTAIILNVPTADAWAAADLVSQRRDTTYLQRRAILSGRKKGIDGSLDNHVIELLNLVLQHRAAGRLLVIIGDPEPYHVIVRSLSEAGFIIPANIAGLDTARRGIWVDYAPGRVPWAPHRIPKPTGKVVSFWRYK